MYFIYFTFIRSVAINKDLSQPLRAKGVRISKTKHDRNQPYYLKSSVHVNVPLILKIDKKECYVCILRTKVKCFIAT